MARPHVLEGVLRLSGDIEEVLNVILNASGRDAALVQLESDYGLSEIQAQGILEMPLDQLTVNGLKVLEAEYLNYIN